MKNKNTLIFTISIVILLVISFISLLFGSKSLNISNVFDAIFITPVLDILLLCLNIEFLDC